MLSSTGNVAHFGDHWILLLSMARLTERYMEKTHISGTLMCLINETGITMVNIGTDGLHNQFISKKSGADLTE